MGKKTEPAAYLSCRLLIREQTILTIVIWTNAECHSVASGDLGKLLRPSDGNSVSNGPAALPHTVEQHDNIVLSYKELIKRQDAQIMDLTSQVKRLHVEIEQEKNKNIDSGQRNNVSKTGSD